jgi:regulator of RNase E activity RraA
MSETNLPTAAITDACLRQNVGYRMGPPSVVPLIPGTVIAGPVRAVLHVGSVDVFFEAMTRSKRGDILVIDNNGRDDQGCIGDLTILEAQHYGLAGVLVWGRHRDTAELRRIGVPVFSRGAVSPGPKGVEKSSGLPVVRFGEVVVSDSDCCFADDDGIVFIDAADRARVVAGAAEIVRGERAQADKVRHGTSLHAQFRWDDYASRRAADPSYDFRRHLQTLGGEIEV